MELKMKLTYRVIRDIIKSKGEFYTKPFSLNIFGIRSDIRIPNAFDDIIGVAYIDDKGKEILNLYKATTDPGTYWLKYPMNVEGTAILLPGYYKGLWTLGNHKGLPAFIQTKPCKVIRDNDKDNELDFDATKIQEGIFGIDLHRASNNMESVKVDKWSAGCQVLANPRKFIELRSLGDKQALVRGSKTFSYCLLTESEFK